MNTIVTMYPVNNDAEQRLRKVTGEDADLFVVTNSTSGSLVQFMKDLRCIRCECVYIYLGGHSSRPLLAMLVVIGFFIRSNIKYLISDELELRPERLSAVDLLVSLMKLFVSEVYAVATIPFAWLRLQRLIRTPRQKIDKANYSRDQVIYVRSVLWLGLSAGGAIAHTMGIIRALCRRGTKVRVVGVGLPRMDSEVGDVETTEVMPTSSYVIPRELNHLVYSRTLVARAIPQLQGESGIIYHRNSLASIAGVEISRATKQPLVLEYNGSENWLASNWGGRLNFMKLVQLAEDVCLKHAHLIVAVSDVLRDQLISKGIEPERVVTIPNGCDPVWFDGCVERTKDQRDNLRHKVDPVGNAKIFTFVGTFGPWHGADTFVRAALHLLENDPSTTCKFLFIGDGGLRPSVERLVEESEFVEHFVFTGLVSADLIPQYLCLSDGLVVPSKNNQDGTEFFGSPTKLFEYMLSSKPIIATAVGQVPDILSPGAFLSEDGETLLEEDGNACGLLVESGAPAALADAIRFVANNAEWGQRAAANARWRAIEYHTWDSNVNLMHTHLEQAASKDSVKHTILINALHAKSGGGVTYIKNILPLLLNDQRFDVHICLTEKQLDLFESYMNAEKMHVLPDMRSILYQSFREQIDIPLLAWRLSAEVTFSPANFGPLLAPGSVILLRNAISVAFVESRLSKKLYWLLLYVATLMSCLFSRQIISVSQYATRATVGLVKGSLNSRITVIPHGVAKHFSSMPPDKRHSKELLVVSDIYVQKNILRLVEALPTILARQPDVILRVAGAFVDQGYTNSIIETYTRLGIEDHVILEGHVDDNRLLELYHSCMVFVFPSTVETFGNPLVEAIACGAAIACSNTSAIPEVVGDAAVLFDPNDTNDIAQKVLQVLEDDALRLQLYRATQARVNNFSWEKTVENTTGVFMKVIGG